MNHHFEKILNLAKQTPEWQAMVNTVEDSPWHREANVAVHTEMCIKYYLDNIFNLRTEKQNMLTLISLLFHDFGKPESEETLEKKDQPGVFYRRYAGHEKISANVMINVIKDNPEIEQAIFNSGLDWYDIRNIKWMIEMHLPYGLAKPEKRKALRTTLNQTLGENEVCFYDQLVSDANGRISDNHAEKLENVSVWIRDFDHVPFLNINRDVETGPHIYMLVGPSGAGKSTWIKDFQAVNPDKFKVVSEDVWRLEYASENMPADLRPKVTVSDAEWYDICWQYCHMNKDSKYDEWAKKRYTEIVAKKESFILDRTNQTKKNRGGWINVARDKGYKIHAIEFYVSEKTINERQIARGDKMVNPKRVHSMAMNMEVAWLGTEVVNVNVVT